jgi:hypothetical protein
MRCVEQAMIRSIWTKTSGKKSEKLKILNFGPFFPMFEAEALLGAL